MANFDYGKEGDVSWSGIAAYAKLQVRPTGRSAGRYEYLDDNDGGFMTIGQKAQTLTLTSDHLVAGALKVRLEYRGDFTDRPGLPNDNGVEEGLAVGRARRPRLRLRREASEEVASMKDIVYVVITLDLLPARVALRPGLRAGLREATMSLEYVVGLLLSLLLLAYLALRAAEARAVLKEMRP